MHTTQCQKTQCWHPTIYYSIVFSIECILEAITPVRYEGPCIQKQEIHMTVKPAFLVVCVSSTSEWEGVQVIIVFSLCVRVIGWGGAQEAHGGPTTWVKASIEALGQQGDSSSRLWKAVHGRPVSLYGGRGGGNKGLFDIGETRGLVWYATLPLWHSTLTEDEETFAAFWLVFKVESSSCYFVMNGK